MILEANAPPLGSGADRAMGVTTVKFGHGGSTDRPFANRMRGPDRWGVRQTDRDGPTRRDRPPPPGGSSGLGAPGEMGGGRGGSACSLSGVPEALPHHVSASGEASGRGILGWIRTQGP